jgi:hypothetical protein
MQSLERCSCFDCASSCFGFEVETFSFQDGRTDSGCTRSRYALSTSGCAHSLTCRHQSGIGEYGDGFADGSPDGCDPLVIVRQFSQMGITLFVVACEPALSGYQFGLDFFRSLTVISSGLLIPLTTAALLSHVIVGSALELMDMEKLIAEVGQAIAEKIHGGLESVDDVAKELHDKLLLRNQETKQLVFESIHVRPSFSLLFS